MVHAGIYPVPSLNIYNLYSHETDRTMFHVSDLISECGKGFYGEVCTSVCSERNCYNNEICNFQTGRCVGGCQDGWNGTTCTSGEYTLVVFFNFILNIIIILKITI